MNRLLDFIYPTFCIFCSSKIEFEETFCKRCSSHLILEMDDSVFHVLEENPISVTYLKFVRNYLPKKHIKVIASFAVIKYFRVFKEYPISISSSRNKLAYLTAKHTAKLLKCSFKKELGFFRKRFEKALWSIPGPYWTALFPGESLCYWSNSGAG